MDAAALQAYVQGIGDIVTTQYASVAAMALWTYDTFANFDNEVEFVWRRKFRLAQMLYVLNRYGGGLILVSGVVWTLYPIPSENFCAVWPYFESYGGLAVLLFIQAVLMIRVCAMYGGHWGIVFTVAAGCFLELVSSFVLGIPLLNQAPFTLFSLPEIQLNACVPLEGIPRLAYTFWIVPLLFDFQLFALAIYRARRNLIKRNTAISSPLIHSLALDSTLVYLYHFSIQFTFTWLWRFGRPGLTSVPSQLGNALDVIFATRLMLNLWQRAKQENLEEETSYDFPADSHDLVEGGEMTRRAWSRPLLDTFWALHDELAIETIGDHDEIIVYGEAI